MIIWSNYTKRTRNKDFLDTCAIRMFKLEIISTDFD